MSRIINIEKLSVGAIPHKIYAADWTVGFADRPSELVVDFIEEDLDFTEVEPTFRSGTEFSVEGKSLGTYFPVSYEIVQNKSQKTMQVRFVDQSSVLDRTLIMLTGQTGFPEGHDGGEDGEFSGELSAGSAIFLGKPIDICAEDIVSGSEALDPCSPCEVSLDDKHLFSLDCQEKEACRRKRYDYSFPELISALGGLGFTVRYRHKLGFKRASEDGDETGVLRVNYTGTFRQVLNNICADLGVSFYHYNGTINFFDLRKGIPIDDADVTDNPAYITQKRIKKSLEGVRANAGVAYFGRDCEERTYECGVNTCKKLLLRPMQLEQILAEPLHWANKKDASDFDALMWSAGLMRMDVKLRQLIIWGLDSVRAYGMVDGAAAEAREGETLDVYNGMTIRKVFHKDSAGLAANRYWELLRMYAGEDLDDRTEARKKGVYFILATKNEGAEEKIVRSETELANKFIGRYWYRHFKERFSNAEYNYLTPDGTAQYYDFKSPVSLPFMDVLTEMYDQAIDSPLFERDEITSTEVTHKTRDAFVLMERNPAWAPVTLEKEQAETIGKYADRFLPHPLEIPQGLNFSLEYEEYDPETDILLVVEEAMEQEEEEGGEEGEGGGIEIKAANTEKSSNELDKENKDVRTEMCGRKVTYGLRSTKCSLDKVKVGEMIIEFFTPSQTFSTSDPELTSSSGYILIVGKTAADGTEQKLNKVEVFGYSGFPELEEAYGEIDLAFSDITREDFKYIVSDDANTCKLDVNQIQTALNDYIEQFAYMDPMFQERSYTVVGIPKIDYSPGDGISSVSFRIGREGVQTTLNYNNRAPARLSPDVFLRRLKHLELRKYNKYKLPSKIRASKESGLPEIKGED